jgi:hypothetical protein
MSGTMVLVSSIDSYMFNGPCGFKKIIMRPWMLVELFSYKTYFISYVKTQTHKHEFLYKSLTELIAG